MQEKDVEVDHGVSLMLQSRLIEENGNSEQASVRPLFNYWHRPDKLTCAVGRGGTCLSLAPMIPCSAHPRLHDHYLLPTH